MITILDNFYSEDIIDELCSLSSSCLTIGCGSSIKSRDLSEISPKVHNQFYNYIVASNNLNTKQVNVTTYLSKYIYEENGINGRIHIDGRNPNSCDVTLNKYNIILGGLIFLSNADVDAGISFYETKSGVWDKQTEFNITLNECYTYTRQQIIEYHKNFYETVNVKNINNRFICWRGGMKHKINFKPSQKEILVQNFYITKNEKL